MQVPQVSFTCPSCGETFKLAVPLHGNAKPGDGIEFKDYKCPSCHATSSGKARVCQDMVEFSFDFFCNG